IPMLGAHYDSRAIQFSSPGKYDNVIRLNYLNLLAGITLPFVQFHFGIDIPLSGSSSVALSEDVSQVARIRISNLKIILEPRIIIYVPIPIDGHGAIVPFLDITFPLTKVFNVPYSLDTQTFQTVGNTIDNMKISILQFGIAYGFDLSKRSITLD
ncbi:MAG: hypothetical protein ACHQM6_04905, partial [Candidatus Kapaibacterium sp.]